MEIPMFWAKKEKRKRDLLPCRTRSQEGSVFTVCCVLLNCMTLVTEVKTISRLLGVDWEMFIPSAVNIALVLAGLKDKI